MEEITLQAEKQNIPKVIEFIDGKLEELACPMKAQMQIDVAVDEMFTNISSYAYGEQGGTATVRFGFDEETRTVRIDFSDSGVPFDPLQREDPDVTLSVEDRPIGGLGIYLVKKTMDRVDYRYSDGYNQLTIYKKI